MSNRRREWLVLTGLTLLALALRLVALGSVPPGVRFDELVNVQMADHIYAGEWPIYFQEAWGHEPLYHYFHALGMTVLGKTVLGVRITSVLFGVLGVLTAYLVLRRMLGSFPAGIAALLLATSFWSLLYSRVGLRHISLPPWVCLSAYCLWRALDAPAKEWKKWLPWFALGGLSAGVSLYTYFASRVVPVLMGLFALYLLIWHRPLLRKRWPGPVLFLVLPALLIIPMTVYLRAHPELEQRIGQVGGAWFDALRAGNLDPVLRSILDTLKMFSFRGDPEWLYNISGRPVFDPLTSIAFCAGLGLAVWHWREKEYAFLLLWLGVGISPSLLSWPQGSLGHTIVAQPAAMGLVALGIAEIWRWASRRQHKWLGWSGKALAIAIPAVSIALNSYAYFWDWPQYREVRHEYQAPITAVHEYLEEHPTTAAVCVSAPYVDYWNPWSKMNFDLYAREAGQNVRWFDGQQSVLLPADTDAIYLLPDHLLLPSGLQTELAEQLLAGAEPVESDNPNLTIYRWTDRSALEAELASVSQVELWASPETALVPDESAQQRQSIALPAQAGHLNLLGYRYSAGQAAPGDSWTVTTYWRVRQAERDPISIFVHVLDDSNQVRAGWDGLYVSPETWQGGDTLVHRHTVHLPADLPPGTYRIEIGVYSPVTLERLPIHTGHGDELAPYARVLLASLPIE